MKNIKEDVKWQMENMWNKCFMDDVKIRDSTLLEMVRYMEGTFRVRDIIGGWNDWGLNGEEVLSHFKNIID